MLALEERGDTSALVTASAGNHGRALALAARASGRSLRVYVPAAAPRIKLDAIRAEGAEMHACADYDEAERRARDDARRTGARYISPYSDREVIAGAGTVGLEIIEELPDVKTIVVPVGGGGLVSGIAIAAREAGIRVVGVEAQASCPFTRSLAEGRVVTVTVGPTLADGLAGNLDPDTITFDIVRRLVDRIVVVPEDEIRAAIRGLAIEERLIAEGAAATAIAALRTGAAEPRLTGQRIAAVLSGANIDPETLRAII